MREPPARIFANGKEYLLEHQGGGRFTVTNWSRDEDEDESPDPRNWKRESDDGGGGAAAAAAPPPTQYVQPPTASNPDTGGRWSAYGGTQQPQAQTQTGSGGGIGMPAFDAASVAGSSVAPWTNPLGVPEPPPPTQPSYLTPITPPSQNAQEAPGATQPPGPPIGPPQMGETTAPAAAADQEGSQQQSQAGNVYDVNEGFNWVKQLQKWFTPKAQSSEAQQSFAAGLQLGATAAAAAPQAPPTIGYAGASMPPAYTAGLQSAAQPAAQPAAAAVEPTTYYPYYTPQELSQAPLQKIARSVNQPDVQEAQAQLFDYSGPFTGQELVEAGETAGKAVDTAVSAGLIQPMIKAGNALGQFWRWNTQPEQGATYAEHYRPPDVTTFDEAQAQREANTAPELGYLQQYMQPPPVNIGPPGGTQGGQTDRYRPPAPMTPSQGGQTQPYRAPSVMDVGMGALRQMGQEMMQTPRRAPRPVQPPEEYEARQPAPRSAPQLQTYTAQEALGRAREIAGVQPERANYYPSLTRLERPGNNPNPRALPQLDVIPMPIPSSNEVLQKPTTGQHTGGTMYWDNVTRSWRQAAGIQPGQYQAVPMAQMLDALGIGEEQQFLQEQGLR
jgi:hypothetical protein